MKKDPTRDYIINAFRLYALWGRPSSQEAEARIYQQALNKYENLEEDVSKIELFVKKNKCKLDDIESVNKMLKILKTENRDYIINAIENVYFYAPNKDLRRNDITNRVRMYAQKCPASESSVYNWLRYARKICAKERGLSVED